MASKRPPARLTELLGVDRNVHEPARLLILGTLHAVKRADFVFLQGQTRLTAGNMSSHMTKLAGAGYVEVEKTFVDNRPQTTYRLTARGRRALRQYLDTVREALDDLAE